MTRHLEVMGLHSKGKHTTTPSYSPLDEWETAGFQNAWLRTIGTVNRYAITSSGVSSLASNYSDTESTSTLLEFGRPSTQNISAARAFAQSLMARAQAINEWVEEQEYDDQFAEIVEPISGKWLKTLNRFKSSPEIAISWDEDE